MFSWLKDKKTPAASATRNASLNEGLHLAMEWGEDWLKPIQKRLSKSHPALSEDELNEINTVCQAAMRFGHSAVYELALKSGKDTKQEEFEATMLARYPWVSSNNLSHLFSQGMYYAWKDSGLG